MGAQYMYLQEPVILYSNPSGSVARTWNPAEIPFGLLDRYVFV